MLQLRPKSNNKRNILVGGLAALVLSVQPLSAFAGPVINEVMPKPIIVENADNEWIELKNSGGDAVNLDGITLDTNGNSSHTFGTGKNIAAGGLFVVCKSLNAAPSCDDTWNGMTLTDKGDTVVLKDGTDEIDSFAYEGSDVQKGASIEVAKEADSTKTPAKNTEDSYGANGNTGTPGAENKTKSIAPVKNTNTGEQFTTIQAAINDAQTTDGDSIEVSDGTFDEFTVTVNDPENLTIRAAAGASPVIEATTPASNRVVDLRSNGTVVEGFTIRSFQSGNGSVVYLDGDNNVIRNNTIEGSTSTGSNAIFTSKDSNPTGNNTITGNTINSPRGINLRNTGNTVTNNDVTSSVKTLSVETEGNTIEFNNFTGAARAVQSYNEIDLNVEKNWWGQDTGPDSATVVVDSNGGSIDSDPWLCQPFQGGSRLSVDGSCARESVTVGVGGDYADLQSGLDGVKAGGTVAIISQITSSSEIVITKPVTINGGGNTLSTTTQYVADDKDNSVIEINNTGDVFINNLVIDGAGGNNLNGLNAFKATASLAGVTLKNNDKRGLNVNGSDITVANISTANNSWGGIDVDINSTSNPARLTLNGTSTHDESEYVADIFVDDTKKDVEVFDTNSQYNQQAYGDALAYKLKPADTSGPSISNKNPAEDQIIGGKHKVSATVTDPSGVREGSVYVRFTSDEGKEYTYYLEKEDGTDVYSKLVNTRDFEDKVSQARSVSFRAVDKLGNPRSSKSKNVIIDNSGPSISAKTPAESITIGGTSYEVSATVKDISGVKDSSVYARFRDDAGKEYTYYLQRQGNTDVYSTTIDTTKIGDGNTGPNRVSFRAVDGLGNPRSSVSENVSIDNASPVVSVINPEKGSVINGTKRFVIEATDQSGVQKVAMYLRNQNDSNKEFALTRGDNNQWYADVDTTQLAGDGTYQLVLRAVAFDGANKVKHFNNREDSYDFVVDNTAPTITVKDNYVGDKTARIFSEVSFKLYDKYKIDYYTINDVKKELGNNEWSDANFQNFKQHLEEGADNTIVLYDVAGNPSSYKFEYDSIAPDASISTDPDTSSNNPAKNPVEVTGSVSAESNIKSHWFEVTNPNGSKSYVYKSTSDKNYSFVLDTSAGDGKYTVRYVATDKAGNRNDDPNYSNPLTREIFIDNTAPIVTMNQPAENADDTWTVNGTNSENYEVVVYLDDNEAGRVQPDVTGSWSFTTTTKPTEGEHTFSAKSTDAAGNESSEQSQNFTVEANDGEPTGVPGTTTGPGNDGQPSNGNPQGNNQNNPTAQNNNQLVATNNLVPAEDANNVQPSASVGPRAVAGAATQQSNDNQDADDKNGENDTLGASTSKGSNEDNGDVLAATDSKNGGQASLFGIAWYWYLVALLGGSGLWWLLALLKRRQADGI